MGNCLVELKERIREDVTRECKEYSEIDFERIKKQIEERPGRYESTAGFYVNSNCGPMYLQQDYHIKPGIGRVIDWPVKTLFHSHGNMTLFLNQERAKQAIEDTKKRIRRLGHVPFSGTNICSTGEGKLVYHFLDDNSRVWIPTSDLIEICDELPQKRWFEGFGIQI